MRKALVVSIAIWAIPFVAQGDYRFVMESEDELSEQLMEAQDLSEGLQRLSQLAKQEPVTVQQVPEEHTQTPYATLPISTEDKQKIRAILVTLAENNVVKLLFEKKRLERLGYEVNHVHPICFLGTVFSDPRLVHCIQKIRSSSFKWDGFIEGFSDRLRQEVKAGNVDSYVPSFAEHLNLSADEIQAYINYRDYEGLVLFLLEKKR